MPLTVPDPDLEIMGAGEGGEGPPPRPPPPGSELANVDGHFCKMKTFSSMFSEAPRTLK